MVITTVNVGKRELIRVMWSPSKVVSESLSVRLGEPGVLGKPLKKLLVAESDTKQQFVTN
jgi:hypothetical protein